MSRRKKKGQGRGSIVFGVLGGIISVLLLLLTFAMILHKNNELAEYVKIAVIMINIISSIICGMIAAANSDQKKLISGALAGMLYFILLIIAGACIDADNIKLVSVCEMGTICLGGSAVGAILNLCKSNKKLRKKAKKHA